MTITKEVIPTKANVSETDLSKFLVVHPGEFIYNPRTHGKELVLDIIILMITLSLVGIILLLR